ncbi:MAG: hypothetical protein GXO79_07865 [Chlorobi bacterium]|nr:hypothetical protein [Chlorobiota bacterium]
MFNFKHYSTIVLFVLIIFLQDNSVRAQYYNAGQDPANIKWHEIKTENFNLIFPESIDSIGEQLANTLEYISDFGSNTLGQKPRKIPVLVHNQSVLSNGIVVWAPKLSELYSIPPQEFEPGNWLSQLVLHEYRHVVQIDNLNIGITKKLTWLFGQQITAAFLGLHVPLWFLEGDAVVAETALSESGRGRIPDFEMKIKAQVVENGKYSYDKAIFGSFKDYVPGRYEFGYQMVSYNRIKYGYELWTEALQSIGKDPLRLSNLSYNLKKLTGLKLVQLYDSTFADLKIQWSNQIETVKLTDFEWFPVKNNKYYTNYNFPIAISNNRLISYRSSIDDVDRFVLLNNKGEEKTLIIPGLSYHNILSYAQNLLVWDEIEFDPRWSNRTYSIIKTLNIETGLYNTITTGSKYLSPSINNKADKIVAVQVDEKNNYLLHILNANNGVLSDEIKTPDNAYPITPVWSANSKKIAVILNNYKGKALVIVTVKTKKFKFVLPYSQLEIKQPFFYKNYILFNSAYSGVANIYAINVQTKQQYRVVSSEYGTKDHFVDTLNNILYYANYTANGYRIVKQKIDTTLWEPIEMVDKCNFETANTIAKHETEKFKYNIVPQEKYDISSYQKGLHLFNIHSWGPFALNLTNNYVEFPGISFLSQNLLGTAVSSFGYSFLLNELAGRYYFDFIYKGFYPEIGFRAETGQRAQIIDDKRYAWSQNKYIATVNLPLSINNGNSFSILNIGIKNTYVNNYNTDSLPNPINKDEYSIGVSLSAIHYTSYSAMDIHPHWFQQIKLNFEQKLGSNLLGNFVALQVKFYFPGIFNHDDIMLYASLQSKNLFSFTDNIILPFGYSGLNTFNINSNSIKWSFPLFYPDIHLGSFIYSKRIKAALFTDLAINKIEGINKHYTAIGAEITSDTYLFRFLAPFEIGYRIAFLPEKNKFYSFAVFSTGINSLR